MCDDSNLNDAAYTQIIFIGDFIVFPLHPGHYVVERLRVLLGPGRSAADQLERGAGQRDRAERGFHAGAEPVQYRRRPALCRLLHVLAGGAARLQQADAGLLRQGHDQKVRRRPTDHGAAGGRPRLHRPARRPVLFRLPVGLRHRRHPAAHDRLSGLHRAALRQSTGFSIWRKVCFKIQ